MRRASGRFSIRRFLKCKPGDEPADLLTAERLFARLCARMLWAEQLRGQGSEEEPPLPEGCESLDSGS
jgi:hypothetical protein